MKYVHTNIVTKDWRRLADFYIKVFNCEIVPPIRDLEGEWLAKGTAVKNAKLKGAHLRLPGYKNEGPTLEIFQYETAEDAPETIANRSGFGHIAFLVDEVKETLQAVVGNGGEALGQIVKHPVDGVGLLTFTYAKDPDGNIIELQNWT